ncbi:molybdopterin converting factor small subunit [Trueperella bonasi]|uniref:Molybdopterin converting factor small subunit n=1 Tax=Trueperella bonasi TaxID=312286 RepID=A0ABT9NFV2_9ACTO|nr:MoaD/ThiS family protein [Trueperella bonasi]MDP9806270.1 molybdopterin converting factor small subunit [Trueperella bonasi]
MKVHVRYFAAAADYAGTDAEVLGVNEGASVADLAAAIKRDRPDSERLARVLDLASFLVNGKRCEPSEILPADAEVDVLPPFAGGSAADALLRIEPAAGVASHDWPSGATRNYFGKV